MPSDVMEQADYDTSYNFHRGAPETGILQAILEVQTGRIAWHEASHSGGLFASKKLQNIIFPGAL